MHIRRWVALACGQDKTELSQRWKILCGAQAMCAAGRLTKNDYSDVQSVRSRTQATSGTRPVRRRRGPRWSYRPEVGLDAQASTSVHLPARLRQLRQTPCALRRAWLLQSQDGVVPVCATVSISLTFPLAAGPE